MPRQEEPKVYSSELKEFISYLQLQRNFSNLTCKSYMEDVSFFLGFIKVNGIRYTEVTPAIIRGYLLDLSTKGLSKPTIKQNLASLKHFYKFLFSQGYIKNDPFEYINSPKLDERLPDFLTEKEIKQLFEANMARTDNLKYRDQAILELLYASGLRASEIISLKYQNIDMKNRVIRVVGKGNKQRIVPFSVSAKSAINNYLEQTRNNLLAKNKTNAINTYLFLNNNGKPLTSRGLEYILKEIEKKSNCYMKLHPHKLRHSFATTMLANGADLRVIQELMGHESIGTTQIYTHVSYTQMKQVYNNCFPRAKIKKDEDEN